MSKYKLNLLAAPKDKAFMKVFKAPKGCSIVTRDISALEPHVLTEASQDPTLLKVYGPGADPNHDIYFVAGMKVPGLKDTILENYNIDNPDPVKIKYLKSIYGKERSLKLKPAYLGWSYGIGPHTLATNLDLTVNEARAMITGLDEQFQGRDRLQRRLLAEWSKNGGYVISGRGTPTCVDFGKKKDIVNRYVQKTGHEILQRILWHMYQYRKQYDLQNKIRPYIVEIHDEVTIAAAYGYEEEAIKMTDYGIDRVNDELNWGVTIKWGPANIGADLSARCE